MLARIRSFAPAQCPAAVLLDGRLLAWAAAWSVAVLVAFGLGSAIIPNAIFGRIIPPEPFAIWTWVVSAPLMGLVLATYSVPVAPTEARPLGAATSSVAADAQTELASPSAPAEDRAGSTIGTIAGLGAFLAIGCPVCNKIALLLLGASGALSIWAPIQPYLAAASLALLVVTLAWRVRLRARGGACWV